MSLETASIAVRAALYLDLMALFGLAAFGLHALRGEERRSGTVFGFGRLLGSMAVAGIFLSGFALLLLSAGMAGVPVAALDRASVDAVIWGTGAGTAWLARSAALVAMVPLALLGRSKPTLALVALAAAGGVALGSLAWTGHGAIDEGTKGWVHLVADFAHLLAAGMWIGALIALLLLVFRPSGRVDRAHLLLSHRALSRFSGTGTAVVAVLVLSGLVNAWLLVGLAGLSSLATSLYTQLLVVKLALFGLMLATAAANRFRFVPSFEASIHNADHRAATRTLRSSLVFETACGGFVLALVAWMGTLEPPVSSV